MKLGKHQDLEMMIASSHSQTECQCEGRQQTISGAIFPNERNFDQFQRLFSRKQPQFKPHLIKAFKIG
jgi:hypothetical protein